MWVFIFMEFRSEVKKENLDIDLPAVIGWA